MHNIKVVCINPGMVDTPMAAGVQGADKGHMIRASDVCAPCLEAALVAVRTSESCCPQEIKGLLCVVEELPGVRLLGRKFGDRG